MENETRFQELFTELDQKSKYHGYVSKMLRAGEFNETPKEIIAVRVALKLLELNADLDKQIQQFEQAKINASLDKMIDLVQNITETYDAAQK